MRFCIYQQATFTLSHTRVYSKGFRPPNSSTGTAAISAGMCLRGVGDKIDNSARIKPIGSARIGQIRRNRQHETRYLKRVEEGGGVTK